MPFLGSTLGYLTAMCSLGWGNLAAIDWNDLPVGREFDCQFLKNVKSPPHALPSPPHPHWLYTERHIIPKPCQTPNIKHISSYLDSFQHVPVPIYLSFSKIECNARFSFRQQLCYIFQFSQSKHSAFANVDSLCDRKGGLEITIPSLNRVSTKISWKSVYWEPQPNQPKPILVEMVGPNRTTWWAEATFSLCRLACEK